METAYGIVDRGWGERRRDLFLRQNGICPLKDIFRKKLQLRMMVESGEKEKTYLRKIKKESLEKDKSPT